MATKSAQFRSQTASDTPAPSEAPVKATVPAVSGRSAGTAKAAVFLTDPHFHATSHATANKKTTASNVGPRRSSFSHGSTATASSAKQSGAAATRHVDPGVTLITPPGVRRVVEVADTVDAFNPPPLRRLSSTVTMSKTVRPVSPAGAKRSVSPYSNTSSKLSGAGTPSGPKLSSTMGRSSNKSPTIPRNKSPTAPRPPSSTATIGKSALAPGTKLAAGRKSESPAKATVSPTMQGLSLPIENSAPLVDAPRGRRNSANEGSSSVARDSSDDEAEVARRLAKQRQADDDFMTTLTSPTPTVPVVPFSTSATTSKSPKDIAATSAKGQITSPGPSPVPSVANSRIRSILSGFDNPTPPPATTSQSLSASPQATTPSEPPLLTRKSSSGNATKMTSQRKGSVSAEAQPPAERTTTNNTAPASAAPNPSLARSRDPALRASRRVSWDQNTAIRFSRMSMKLDEEYEFFHSDHSSDREQTEVDKLVIDSKAKMSPLDALEVQSARNMFKFQEAKARAFLGCKVTMRLKVTEVQPHGAAALGGMLVGDVLVGTLSIAFRDGNDFVKFMEQISAGDTVVLKVRRGLSADLLTLSMVVGAVPVELSEADKAAREAYLKVIRSQKNTLDEVSFAEVDELLSDMERYSRFIRRAFDIVDVKASGRINQAQYRSVIQVLSNAVGMNRPFEDAIDAAFAQVDRKATGFLNLQETGEATYLFLDALTRDFRPQQNPLEFLTPGGKK